MANELRFGPVPLDQPIHPGDADEFSRMDGVVASALDISNIVDRMNTEAARMTPAQSLPPDHARSAVIDDLLPEVQNVIDDELDTKLTIEGASVRGTTGDDAKRRLVVYVARTESGRSVKGVMPYAKFPAVERAYQDRKTRDLDAARAAKSAGGNENAHGEDPRVQTLQKALDDAESKLRDSEAKPKGSPEPWEGYDSAKMPEIVDAIDREGDPLEREILKRSVRARENARDKPRQGVLDATEPVELVESE